MSSCLRCFTISAWLRRFLLTLTWPYWDLTHRHNSESSELPRLPEIRSCFLLFWIYFWVFASLVFSFFPSLCFLTVKLCHTNDITVALAAHLWNQGNPRVLDLSLTTNRLCAPLTAPVGIRLSAAVPTVQSSAHCQPCTTHNSITHNLAKTTADQTQKLFSESWEEKKIVLV